MMEAMSQRETGLEREAGAKDQGPETKGMSYSTLHLKFKCWKKILWANHKIYISTK